MVGMGPSPMGGPDPMGLEALGQLQSQPSPGGEEQALADASLNIGMALTRIHMRSPRAARLLSDALSKLNQAREALQTEASAPVGAPPNLLGGLTPNTGMTGSIPQSVGGY